MQTPNTAHHYSEALSWQHHAVGVTLSVCPERLEKVQGKIKAAAYREILEDCLIQFAGRLRLKNLNNDPKHTEIIDHLSSKSKPRPQCNRQFVTGLDEGDLRLIPVQPDRGSSRFVKKNYTKLEHPA